MSHWTYVRGVIEVDTYARSDAEAMYFVQTVISHLPKITGSERDVMYHVNRCHGHNMCSSHDEFMQPSNLGDGELGGFYTQTRFLITIEGNLRDRLPAETIRETTKMLSRLASRLDISSCVVSVSDTERRFVFDSPGWLLYAADSDWTRDLVWSFTPEGEQ